MPQRLSQGFTKRGDRLCLDEEKARSSLPSVRGLQHLQIGSRADGAVLQSDGAMFGWVGIVTGRVDGSR